jgi:hypothetical protein
MCKRWAVGLGLLVSAGLALVAEPVQDISQPGHYGRKEVHKLMQRASTPEEYRLLASYFRTKEKTYRLKASSDQQQYERVRKAVYIPKFPTPAETAKSKEQYDEYKADQMAALAMKYEQQAFGPMEVPKTKVTRTSAEETAETNSAEQVHFTANEQLILQKLQDLEHQVQSLHH